MDGEVTQSSAPIGCRATAPAVPGIEAKMVVVTPCAQEERAHALPVKDDIKAKHTVVEVTRLGDVRHLEVHMAQPRARRQTIPGASICLSLCYQGVKVKRV